LNAVAEFRIPVAQLFNIYGPEILRQHKFLLLRQKTSLVPSEHHVVLRKEYSLPSMQKTKVLFDLYQALERSFADSNPTKFKDHSLLDNKSFIGGKWVGASSSTTYTLFGWLHIVK
jgi:hypothetical protein